MKSRRPLHLLLETLEDRCLLATRVWDGGGLNNNWTNANNWTNNTAPVAGDDLVFLAGINDKVTDNNFADGTHFRSITVQGGYTLRGNKILLGEGGIVASGSSNIINNDFNLGAGADRTINVNAGSTLFMDGRIEGGNGLLKSGGGDLSFRANNVYTGLTDILAGRLFVEKDESLGGSASGTIIRGGATLLVNDTALGTLRTQEPITVHSGGTIRAVNDVELRGTITTVGVANFKHDGGVLEKLLVNANITGTGGLNIQSGTGRVWLKGPSGNSYQGNTTVSGELHLDNAHGAVPGNLIIQAGGHVVREDSAINGGMLTFDAIGDGATVTVNAGGVFTFAVNHARERIHALHLNGGKVEGTATSDGRRGFFLTEFRATSTSANQPAELKNLNLVFFDVPETVVVLDGPAFNDLVVSGTEITMVDSRGVFLNNTMALLGGGTMLDSSDDTSVDSSVEIVQGLYRTAGNKSDTNVIVLTGAQFAGEGTIKSLTVHAGGRVRPGPLSSTGKLNVGDLQMDPGAILEVLLNGSVAGSGHDQLDVSGTIAIESAILEPRLGPSATFGQNYRILNNQGSGVISGEFVAPQTVPPTGQQLLVNYFGGTLNNDVVLSLINTAPMAPGLAIDQTDITAGTIVTVTGHLVDRDGPQSLKLLVDWGDGSKKQILKPGLADFTLRHRYRRPGQFVARFKWIDQTGEGNSREFTINVEPGIPLGGNQLRSLTDRVFALGLRR